MENIILWAVILGIVGFIIYKINYQIQYGWYGSGYQRAGEKSTSLENSALEQITALGTTAQEREIAINRLFDEKKHIFFLYDTESPNERHDGRKNTKYIFVAHKVSRSLATMNTKDREFLRFASILYVHDKISLEDFKILFIELMIGDGKAVGESFFTDGISHQNNWAVPQPFFKRHEKSADKAITKILKIIDTLPDNDSIKTKLNARLHGGTSWLTEADIPKSAFQNASNHSLRIGKLQGSDYVLRYSGEGSLVTIAPPGSGKTQCFVLPNMLDWDGPAFVLDIKGEIYSATHKWRSENVGKIYKFSPLDPSNSHSYNPLTFVRQDPDYLWEDARFLADMMIVPSGGSDPFWENTARDILTAAIAYVCLNNTPENRPMVKVLDLIYGIGLPEMIVDLKQSSQIDAMRQMGHSLFDMEVKTLDGALKSAQASLSAWQGERIKKTTSKCDWNPLSLREEKATVYICINPNEIDSYLSLLRVVIAQHIRILTSKLPERGTTPILFMLDELPRLKKMPPVEEALNIGRQYGVKLWMFAQSYGQLKNAYPDVDGFIGACAVRVFMNIPLNDELAKKISDQLGYQENPFDNSRRKLVEPIDLAGPEYQDVAIVIAASSKPAKVQKEYAWDNESLKGKMQ